MKKLFVTLIMAVVVLAAVADPVGSSRAKVLALDYLKKVGPEGLVLASKGLVDVSDTTLFSNIFIFKGSDGQGFVLVGNDDGAYPVLGYSCTGVFATVMMPEHIREWLWNYNNQLDTIRAYNLSLVSATSLVGDDDGPESDPQDLILPPHVRPLLTTTWNQSPYYNAMCPDYSIYSKCVAGCVATATAQIMKYWNWPERGEGSHSYNTSYGTLSADFGNTVYDWQNMPNVLNGNSLPVQVGAVATLIYHIGVALETAYGTTSTAYTNPNSAGMPSAESVLKTYFGYSPNLGTLVRSGYTDGDWCALLQNELNARRPILYSGHGSGGGHSFVMDGYDENGMFHINWGWGGYCDGYYQVGALNPGTGGIGSGSLGSYNSSNKAIVGIEPVNNAGSTANITASANNPDWGRVTGAGQYVAYSDNVTLTAIANPGCRFVGWSDGISANPRTFLATNNDENYIALFTQVGGDTLYYCLKTKSVDLDFRHWGIRIPSTMIAPGQELQQVQAFISSPGTYQIQIYNGYYPFPHLIYSQDIYSYTVGRWNTYMLNEPLQLTGVENIWITIASADAVNPTACSAWSGNTEAQYCSYDGVRWHELGRSGSCMVKGIFYTPEVVDPLPTIDPTPGPTGGVVLEIGSENSSQTESVMPVCTNHKYSLVQIILKASELNGAHDLGGISFYYNSNTPLTAKTNCNIYITPFADPQFWSVYNYQQLNSSAVLVYSGPLNCQKGWNRFDFSTPYSYNGNGNLVVIIEDNSGGKQNNALFKVESCSTHLALAYHREGSGGIINNPYWPDATKGYYTKRPVMKLYGVGSGENIVPDPPAPGLEDTLFVHDTVYYIDTVECAGYTLTVRSNDSTMGMCISGGVFKKGATVELMAMPFPGWRFVGWSDGGVDNPRRITIFQDTEITGNFEPLILDGDDIDDEEPPDDLDDEDPSDDIDDLEPVDPVDGTDDVDF